MIVDPNYKPRLRPVEALPLEDEGGLAIAVRDPSGLSDVVLSMSLPALQLLSLMDGSKTVDDICSGFAEIMGEPVAPSTVLSLVEHLEDARFLEGPRFEQFYQSELEAYRARGVRDMPHAAQLGIVDGSGLPFSEIIAEGTPLTFPRPVRGVVAPHLDYPRGRPCYADAYAALRDRPAPDRVVILGTNHFGRSLSVVTTGNDFETPLGRTSVDRAFIDQLERACGDLRRYELDHAREHSIELQLGFLQHLFGPERFTIVPVLCPDPCAPADALPPERSGVDLKDFATALRDLIAQDAGDTLVVAGADMSHVGASFGDEQALTPEFLREVEQRDRAALERFEADDPAGFVAFLAEEDNPTRVCSAGCLYVIRTVLPGAAARIVRYHQAVDDASSCCVTCAAAILV